MASLDSPGDLALDLYLERVVPVSCEQIWEAWTKPELLVQWFTPAPWRTEACRLDLRPGGEFWVEMASPDGTLYPNVGCYLEVVPQRRLTWTNSLLPGFRPAPSNPEFLDPQSMSFAFTARIDMTPLPEGTRYRATALHADAVAQKKHAGLGFHDGWSRALDQLLALFSR